MRVFQGVHTSDKNPRYCAGCHSFTTKFPGGAEIELTMLFVDVRGSTSIAEMMDTHDFSDLMNRFYEAAIKVLVQADAFIDKLVGLNDETPNIFGEIQSFMDSFPALIPSDTVGTAYGREEGSRCNIIV